MDNWSRFSRLFGFSFIGFGVAMMLFSGSAILVSYHNEPLVSAFVLLVFLSFIAILAYFAVASRLGPLGEGSRSVESVSEYGGGSSSVTSFDSGETVVVGQGVYSDGGDSSCSNSDHDHDRDGSDSGDRRRRGR